MLLIAEERQKKRNVSWRSKTNFLRLLSICFLPNWGLRLKREKEMTAAPRKETAVKISHAEVILHFSHTKSTQSQESRNQEDTVVLDRSNW